MRRTQTFSPSSDLLPTLLTYKSGRLDEHHKVKLKVRGGEWSKTFVLGTIGKVISVVSRKGNFPYEVNKQSNYCDVDIIVY